MTEVLNPSALEPLYEAWEEPNAHRIPSKEEGGSAERVKGRRPSQITIPKNLRSALRDWREAGYAGASDTSRHLLDHWFNRSHQNANGTEFRYYFCQREAIEVLIYLYEVRQKRCLSQIIEDFGGAQSELAALGVTEDDDAWTRYAFKLATGTGKTKVMSLAIVWSYFHSIRESHSDLTRNFLVIAPNLTVYERLRMDFAPTDGRSDIFKTDPLIPSEWLGDWNLSVVLQDETSGAATNGVLYLTNIHRLFDLSKRKRKDTDGQYAWAGPPVSKAKALDTGEALRERITQHPNMMVFNDEAHHVWDPGSAWNEAIAFLHSTIRQRGGAGITAQLDFSATPKDDKGNLFKHIVCDTPLGEAVDAGIVKTPIIGKITETLIEQPNDNAAYRYEQHLRTGYERWKISRDEWIKSRKKALLFVMCENTEAADQITRRFNTDEFFKDLNGKTINLHTNLKGKTKKVGHGASATTVFEESDKEISDDDLKALRELSRKLDSDDCPYACIVSVLMLREGWDVRNVTTIVPLRPYSSKANILPEQTLGRGLRRMTPPGQACEIVTVVEHKAFASLYKQELAQEGLPIADVEIEKIPKTTVSIFPDKQKKDCAALDILLPRLTAGYSICPTLSGLTIAEVKKRFSSYRKLPLGKKINTEINYEGRHLFTGEVIERMKIQLPLLKSGVGALSFYIKEIEYVCKVHNTHNVLAPLLQEFLEDILFEEQTDIFDARLIARLGNPDVREHVRAVFVPLVRAHTVGAEQRQTVEQAAISISAWKPFQVTHSERHPVKEGKKTLFNLVPCNRDLEVAMTTFADRASDIAAFAKNAGPQSLRIDYQAQDGRLAFYTPDFFIRTKAGKCFLVETKGREDRDVPSKALAAMAWCASASSDTAAWEYLYVPQGVFQSMGGDSIEELARTCQPALQTLLQTTPAPQQSIFDALARHAEEVTIDESLVSKDVLEQLPTRYREAVEQATTIFRLFEQKKGLNYASVFTSLLGSLDDAAKAIIVSRLGPHLPVGTADQRTWFDPYLQGANRSQADHFDRMAKNLKKTLVFNSGLSPIGLLRSCFDYALNESAKLGGVFDVIKEHFRVAGGRKLLEHVTKVNEFRNTYIAHQEDTLKDADLARKELVLWINTLKVLTESVKT
ncbi:MAG: DEAD/DEAH box helicase family protein [Candidatus Peribacteraceae bacterium]|nr:DEAD/DEAH box helicase family protein [Candidatus Peribacteraceae bacterium]